MKTLFSVAYFCGANPEFYNPEVVEGLEGLSLSTDNSQCVCLEVEIDPEHGWSRAAKYGRKYQDPAREAMKKEFGEDGAVFHDWEMLFLHGKEEIMVVEVMR